MEEGTRKTTDDARNRRCPRGGVFFPLLLIALGVILLLNTTGRLQVSLLSLVRLWPLLLILVGLDVLLGGRSAVGNLLLSLLTIAILAGAVFFVTTVGPAPSAALDEWTDWALGEVEAMDARVDFAFGELEIDTLPDSSDRAAEVDYTLLQGFRLDSNYEAGGERADLYVSQTGREPSFEFWRDWGNSRMNVALSQAVPVNLNAELGAGEMTLDLTDLEVEGLDAEVGAGELTVTLPEDGDFAANISVGVGDLTVIVPDGVEARIVRDGGLSPVSVGSRFEKVGDAYVTPGYDDADSHVDLRLEVGVGAIDVR